MEQTQSKGQSLTYGQGLAELYLILKHCSGPLHEFPITEKHNIYTG